MGKEDYLTKGRSQTSLIRKKKKKEGINKEGIKYKRREMGMGMGIERN